MKRFMAVLALGLVGLAFGQEASLQTPVPRASEAKYRVQEFSVNASQAVVTIEVLDSGNPAEVIRVFAVVDGNPAAFLTALDTVRATETGGALRRGNFRILGRLSDAGLISGVNLVP